MKLADFVEQISDDFQSTFSVVDEDTLANCLGMASTDFEQVETIIRKYIPGANAEYAKTNQFGEDSEYDIYLVRVKS